MGRAAILWLWFRQKQMSQHLLEKMTPQGSPSYIIARDRRCGLCIAVVFWFWFHGGFTWHIEYQQETIVKLWTYIGELDLDLLLSRDQI